MNKKTTIKIIVMLSALILGFLDKPYLAITLLQIYVAFVNVD